MYKIFLLLCTILFITSCGSPRPIAQSLTNTPQGWSYLGDKWVNFGVDHDELFLGNFKDDVRQIRLRVTDGPVHIMDMKVHFDNGSVQDVPIRSLIRQGDQSRVIDLDGGLRHLNKIAFWYETVGFRKGKARVAVWGYR
jgi:hypothetical protein